MPARTTFTCAESFRSSCHDRPAGQLLGNRRSLTYGHADHEIQLAV